jgi:very-short-patch-repair endonuclease
VEAGSLEALVDVPSERISPHTPNHNRNCVELSTSPVDNSTHLVSVLGVRGEVHVRGPLHSRLALVAARQRECISHEQVLAVGASDRMIETLLAKGTLHRRHRGVYGFGRTPIAFAPEAAALLAIPRAVALSGRSAARLWGIPLPAGEDRRPEVLVIGHGSLVRGITVRRTRTPPPPQDLRIRNGLPVTSPARTLHELARALTPFDLQRAVDEAFIAKLITDRQLREMLARRPRRALRELLDREAEPALTRSGGERRLRRLLKEAGLPQPLSNVKLHGFTVDFYWPEHDLVVELDGRPYHSRARAFERDHRKDQVLRAHGLQPLRVTGAQLRHHPVQVAVLIAQALAG